MKYKLLMAFLPFVYSVSFSSADQPGSVAELKKEKCGIVQYTDFLKSKDPALQQLIINDEIKLQQSINNLSPTHSVNAIYTIPVVVHVVYFNNSQNISDAQVKSQIDVLNEDFSRTNLDASNTPAPFAQVASATNFQFCLARKDPNGNTTNGIERRQSTVQVFPANTDVKHFGSGGLDAWDVTRYLNIWVCDLGGQILGYGDIPTSVQTDNYGAVIQYNVFGRTGTVIAPYQFGRTCTHEISHCFNLYHIWGDEDACSGTDFINDTPNQAEATFGCHSFPFADICTTTYPGIMFMNYMDYSDDNCMNMFTKDQTVRMLASVNTYYPTLLTSTACLADGIESVSDFEFSIYPNPTSGFLDIVLFTTKNIGSRASIKITDVLGKIVFESVIEDPTRTKIRLDLHQLNDGIYFVSMFNEKYKRTQKIIFNRN